MCIALNNPGFNVGRWRISWLLYWSRGMFHRDGPGAFCLSLGRVGVQRCHLDRADR